MIEEGALGVTSGDHVPFASRYSPTLVGIESDPVVPSAMHESDVVQALVCRGTEIPMDGKPETCVEVVVAQLARRRPLRHRSAPSRHAWGPFDRCRLMVLFVPSCLSP
jgi:hypothetical protein